ncbi:MAG TPA: hypothetical protein VH350_10345 [Candidatus Sulfotelmatobacter sp.]|nr:hypothetical protein [Candidatus Sulfotelmatobacter sp.]
MVLLPGLLLAVLMPAALRAQQDDANDTPLGDVARSLRKKNPPAQDVIDDDNLTQVMQQAETRHAPGTALQFLMAGEDKGFRVAGPDVSCSLSFNVNAKSLLSNAYAQMELPAGEVSKLDGPATIEGDTIIVPVYNRTEWHVSEVSVALTVVKKAGNPGDELPELEVRPEKKPDVTVIYRMRAAAAPSATTVFSARLNVEIEPDEEWHWAIVQARGYPPQSYSGNEPQTAAETNMPASTLSPSSQPESIPLLAPPRKSAPSLPPNPSVESTSPETK